MGGLAHARVGFIGVGRMGQPMCRHLLRAGFPLTVFDVQPEATEAVVALGARQAAGPRELAAQSDVIVIMVVDDAQVREVIAGKEGLLQGARAGTVIAISSSVHPNTCRDLAQAALARGIGLVDAPVALGVRFAEEGELTVFAGGEQKDVEACRPVFAAYSKSIFHMGPVGTGQITKTCNNLLLWSGIVACYETLALGARLGVHPDVLRPALEAGSADSWVLRQLHTVGLYWPHKDMDIALELAKENDARVPLMEDVRGLIAQITAHDLRQLFASMPKP